MAPVVHGLEQEYRNRIDFLYLNIADEANAEAERVYGFTSTPHFFFLRPDGSALANVQGVVPADSVRRFLDAQLGEPQPARDH